MLKNYLQLIRFDKPIGTLLLLWPNLWALFFASDGKPQLKYIVVFTLGVFLTRSAGCAFNDLFDREFDKSVARTKSRPLASGSISVLQALIVGLILSLIAFILAIVVLDTKTILLCIPAIIIYVTYPLFKRFCPIPQAYLGLAFSFGILMVFMQVDGYIGVVPICLFMGNFFWVIGYDTIYALVDLDDDIKIGIKTSAITFKQYVNYMIAFCYILFIGIMLGVGIYLHVKIWYFIGLGVSFALLSYQVISLIQYKKDKYFELFLLNNWVGIFILIGIMLS